MQRVWYVISKNYGPKTLVVVAALLLVFIGLQCDGQAGANLPASPLTFFSSPVTGPPSDGALYLPLVAKNADLNIRWPAGPYRIHLPVILRTYAPIPAPTPTPLVRQVKTPTPTPTPKWPAALSEPGRSKLGLHVIQNNTPDIMEFIRRTKPPVVKGLGGFGWAIDVKKVSPETVTIGRLLEAPGEGLMIGDPEEAARAFVARHLEEYRLNPGVDYWEGWNEPVPTSNMDWYARFEMERTRLMAEHGFRVAVGGFATGTPEWEEFAAFLPAIEAALAHDGILTLHEYSAPTLEHGLGQGLPGHPGQPDRGTLTLRYRWWYEDFLKPRGLVIPLVISEGGIDGQVWQDLTAPGLGWRDFTDYWTQQGMGPDGGQIYVDQLAWYDGELQKDDYVIGLTIFSAGSPSGQWKSFDVTNILPKLAEYIVTQR